jgi:hypothetical protein
MKITQAKKKAPVLNTGAFGDNLYFSKLRLARVNSLKNQP